MGGGATGGGATPTGTLHTPGGAHGGANDHAEEADTPPEGKTKRKRKSRDGVLATVCPNGVGAGSARHHRPDSSRRKEVHQSQTLHGLITPFLRRERGDLLSVSAAIWARISANSLEMPSAISVTPK